MLAVSDIGLSGAQLHAGAMAQLSFPHHSVRIKLISSNDICPIGSISYSCPPEERWWRRSRVNLKWPSMKLILTLLQSVQMKLVYDTKCFEQIMAVQCVNIFPATAGSTLSFSSELKVISNPFYPEQSLRNSYILPKAKESYVKLLWLLCVCENCAILWGNGLSQMRG